MKILHRHNSLDIRISSRRGCHEPGNPGKVRELVEIWKSYSWSLTSWKFFMTNTLFSVLLGMYGAQRNLSYLTLCG